VAGRVRPYTRRGLRRVPCRRCGEPSVHQWSLRPCALGTRRWYGLCLECDVILNSVVMQFLRVPDHEEILRRYIERSA
jgi:hypothetical protein